MTFKEFGPAPVGIGDYTLSSVRPVDRGSDVPQTEFRPYVYGEATERQNARAAWQGSDDQPPCLRGETSEDRAAGMAQAKAVVEAYVSLQEKPSGKRS